MAVKKVEPKETRSAREWSRKVALAYLGVFGMASDEFGKLFELAVKRGERVERDVRKRVHQNGKGARQFANEIRKEQRVAAGKASKTLRKAVKHVETFA